MNIPAIALLFLFSANVAGAQKTYVLIPHSTGKLDTRAVAKLPASLKGLAALYAALGGTGCEELKCGLTTALGLGDQGSVQQKDLIKKYFPGDKVASLVLGQDCYLPPTGSTSFSNFNSLAFVVSEGKVKVLYQLALFEKGATKIINGPDIYGFDGRTFKNRKRVLYAWADK